MSIILVTDSSDYIAIILSYWLLGRAIPLKWSSP